jgi:glyoxylase-like metal-dependent hydrolase (beta-lactamase superfamily II)
VLDEFDDLLFPAAAFHIGRAEWEFWRSEGALAAVGPARESFVAGARLRLDAIEDRVSLIEPGAEVLPGIEAVASFGHTPGHLAYVIHAGEGMVVVGDALAHPLLSFRQPRWPTAMDQDPVAAADTRLRLLDRLAAERRPIIGYHLPEPGVGRVDRLGGAYAFVA